MNIDLGKVSYLHTGFILNYIAMQDKSILRPDKKDSIYSNIKAHPDFIQINHTTYVNYVDIDIITSMAVRMYCGKEFEFGGRYRKYAIDKYVKLCTDNIWKDALRE